MNPDQYNAYLILSIIAVAMVAAGISLYLKKKNAKDDCILLAERILSAHTDSSHYIIDRYFELERLVSKFKLEVNFCGFTDMRYFANSAYQVFCEYIIAWEKNHQKLEKEVLSVKLSEDPLYLDSILTLGPAFAASRNTLDLMIKKRDEFKASHITPIVEASRSRLMQENTNPVMA